ncbi:MAG: hypothetical protein ABIK73_06760 [candidate division WOR-3 bacterium]
MVFRKNGNGTIETNWRTLAAIFSSLSVIIGLFTTIINIGIAWGQIKKDIDNIKTTTHELRLDVKEIREKIPALCAEIDEHSRRLAKLER